MSNKYLFKIEHGYMSGQAYNCLIRFQIGYSVLYIGGGCIPKGWQGLQWGIFTPAKLNGVYRRYGFEFSLLPALPGAVCMWPRWYRFLNNVTSFRFPSCGSGTTGLNFNFFKGK